MAGFALLFGSLGLIIVLFVFALPIALMVALQVWLCKKSLKLGLILPCISLALSLILVLSMATFSTLTVTAGNTMVTPIGGGATQSPAQEDYIEIPAQEEDYVEVPAQEGVPRQKTEFHPQTLLAVGVVFLVSNIPTVVFGGIWLHYKGRQDTLEDLKRMRIEDLE